MVSTPFEKARWTLRSRNVATPHGIQPAAVVIRGEIIEAIVPFDQIVSECPVHDVGDRFILPGLVDTHVHINEPGRTEWEGFETATRAAAAGGVTTLIDMPLNSSPVTTTHNALQQKLAAAEGKLRVDVGFYGGIIPGNTGDIPALIAGGVFGFKAFLCHSGIDEFPNATEADLRAALPLLASAGLPLLAHCELVESPSPSAKRGDDGSTLARRSGSDQADPKSYAGYLASRPRAWEHRAIELFLRVGRECGGHIHVVHLSSADALPMLAEAKAAGMPLTVETCPHYLFFTAEEIPDGDPRFKCAPPIRERENRDRLWQALRAGLIDTIGSDHSPAPPDLKQLESGDFMRAWGGIASLQLLLPALWTVAKRDSQTTLADLVDWLCHRPAKLVGLEGRKGSLVPGADADLVVFDPHREFVVAGQKLQHRHPITPYEGKTLRGRVDATYLRGQKIFDGENLTSDPIGRTLLRGRTT